MESRSLKDRIWTFYWFRIYLPAFQKLYLPLRVRKLRNKKKVRFLFVLQNLPQWKTEPLYLAMLQHPRFEPILGITDCIEIPGAEKEMEAYCQSKGYEYIYLDPKKPLKQAHPDVVMFQKPYKKQVSPEHFVDKNLSIPIVLVPYGMGTVLERWILNRYMLLLCWQQYHENQSINDEKAKIHLGHGQNFRVTGLPMMDILCQSKEHFPDPWGDTGGKKRIIYAPHHTIADIHDKGLAFSTFLDNGEFVVEMAKKYEKEAYFVFKPHPLLYKKLLEYWGKEKTDAYYNQWRSLSNGHIEEGEYLGLFKHSDAMIHDCGSFTVEYLYTGNPVMFLINDEHHGDNLCTYMKEAFELHEMGRCHADIEQFVKNVIDGKDPRKEERDEFVKRELTPPHGKSACENIMNAILGLNEYAKS